MLLDGTTYISAANSAAADTLVGADPARIAVGRTRYHEARADLFFYASDTARNVLVVAPVPAIWYGVPKAVPFVREGVSFEALTADTAAALEFSAFHDRDTDMDILIGGGPPCTDPDVIAEFFDVMEHGAPGSSFSTRYTAEIAVIPADPALAGFRTVCKLYSDGSSFCGYFEGKYDHVAIPRELVERIAGCRLMVID